MDTNRKTDSTRQKETGFSRIEKLHPFKTFMFFGLVGSTVLFLSFSFLYFVTISRNGMPEDFTFPKIFTVSTVLMLISSYFISGTAKAFRNDSVRDLKFALVGTFVLGTLFCLAQSWGLFQMYESGFFINTNVGVAYLYVIAVIHLLHVAGGMIFLTSMFARLIGHTGDVVKSLLYFTDGEQLTRLELAVVYWHFIDALWLVLFFMFLFSF